MSEIESKHLGVAAGGECVTCERAGGGARAAGSKVTSCVLAGALALGGAFGAGAIECSRASDAFATEISAGQDAAVSTLSVSVNSQTFAAAVQSATAGETLTLAEDVTVTGSLEIAAAVTIDLNGHALNVNACTDKAAGSYTGGAITYTGTGTLRVCDSAAVGKKGALNINVGRPVENKQSTTAPYAGVAVMAGEFSADGCAINVTYAGASTVKPEFKLFGVMVGAGASGVTLGAGAALTVNSAPESGAYGAVTACGIYALGTDSSAGTAEAQVTPQATITCASTSTVTVNNVSAAAVQGTTPLPNGVVASTGTSTTSNLVELEFDASNPLYDQVQEAFKQNAKFDSLADTAGYTLGSQMYYMSGVKLACGLTVWAYSDPVDAESAGHLSAIVATHVFVQATYQTPLEAYGVSAADTFAGSVVAQGSIDVNTNQGHAVGVLEGAGGTWKVSATDATANGGEGVTGAKITGSVSSETYNARKGKLDLAAYVDAPDGASYIFGKSGSNAYEIRVVAPVCVAHAKAADLTDARVSGRTYAELYGSLVPAESYTTTEDTSTQSRSTQLVYYRKAVSGSYIYTSETLSGVDWTSDVMSAANERVQIGSMVTIDGVVYTFLGWSPRATDLEPVFTDSMQLLNSGNAISGGTAVFYGIYSSEAQNFGVRFVVDGSVYAQLDGCAGTSTVYSAFGQTGAVAPVSTREGVTFKGWATEEGSATTVYANIKTLNNLAQYASADKVITLYGVWSDAEAATQKPADTGIYVSFYDSDGTLVDKVGVPAGLTVFETLGEYVTVRGAAVNLFEGWYDAFGNEFSQDTTQVTTSVSVYAKYKQTGTSSGVLAGAGATSGGAAGAAGSTGAVANTNAGGSLSASGSSSGALLGAASATGAVAKSAQGDAQGGAGDEEALAGEGATGALSTPDASESEEDAQDAGEAATYSDGVAYASTLDGEAGAGSAGTAALGLTTFCAAVLAFLANGVRIVVGRRRSLAGLEAEAAAAEEAQATDSTESVRF
jgi:hypothetical protein